MIPDNIGVQLKTSEEFEVFKKIATIHGETRINNGKFNYSCNWWKDDRVTYGTNFVAAKHKNRWKYADLNYYNTHTKIPILSFGEFYSKYYKYPDYKYLL